MDEDHDKAASGIDAYIDENLRRVYAALEEEDIPERFKQLLDKLEAQDAQSNPNSSSTEDPSA